MISAERYGALYVAKTDEGEWDWTWTTTLQLIAWAPLDDDAEVTPTYTGLVIPPEGVGEAAADLVRAADAHVTGSDGRVQHFIRYVNAPGS